jgi:uncharacterized Zn finger protein
MGRNSGWDDWYFPPSKPLRAEGGIRSQSKKGTFGESWWARRWIQVLEGFSIGSRLTRGRSYARGGQVLAIAIENGKVTARVQGSRPRPYDVAIEVKTLSKAEWSKVVEALGRQALYAAKLLAGEMPPDIEEVFKEVGLSLFPARLDDLETDCSCPDWSNPCKHIAAVYYLLGEEFDRDPFLIFALRGMDRDALIARLGTAAPSSPEMRTLPRPAEPLSVEMPTFWGDSGARPDDSSDAVEIPREPAALARRLGGFPFWRGETPLLDSLAPIYAAASPRGLDVLLGSTDEPDRSEVE